MWANFSKLIRAWNWRMALIAVLWVSFGFAVAQITIWALFAFLDWLGVPLIAVGVALLQSIAAVLVYILTLLIVLGAPVLLKKRRVTLEVIGLDRLPLWKDIGLAPLSFIAYFFISGLLLLLLSSLFPGLNFTQAQEIGFDQLTDRSGYMLAFFTLVVVAPLAEEVLFRGYLYGKLRSYVPIWFAVIATSALFGAVHGQLNVAIDTFVLSVVMCSLREFTGSIWAGVLLHMLKNGVAFYLLFVNPGLLGTIGG